MNARLIKVWQDVQSSYYFLPSLMGLGACILAFAAIHVDENYGFEISKNIGIFNTNKANSARVILSTIAGSMISVAAVTFSITMVAVTSAAGQYGPRLIGNFMRDRGNQVTLGTFTSTFIYCLFILRVTRTGNGKGADIVDFVPNVSLLIAMILTFLSVAVMIFFIHHIPETLNVGNITAQVGRQLRNDLENMFPAEFGHEKHHEVDMETFDAKLAVEVEAHAEGYIQTINHRTLMKLARMQNAQVKIECRPGDFVVKGTVLMRIWSENTLSKIERGDFRKSFAMGHERTAHQNVLFLADELVEILARALSPGINDPFTAINCINWFYSALQAAMQGTTPSAFRFDEEENLRLIAHPISFSRLVSVICDQSRPYISSDANATLKMLAVLTILTAECEQEQNREHLKAQLVELRSASKCKISEGPEHQRLQEHFDASMRMISDPEFYQQARYSDGWIGGRA